MEKGNVVGKEPDKIDDYESYSKTQPAFSLTSHRRLFTFEILRGFSFGLLPGLPTSRFREPVVPSGTLLTPGQGSFRLATPLFKESRQRLWNSLPSDESAVHSRLATIWRTGARPCVENALDELPALRRQ
uniref:Uncharacterized protein n=1 Tax=Trichuris muris TaxID=70415 RepID=A0A5S6Q6W7_TRIMR